MRNALDKNLAPVPRTLSEANRDADYATAMWRCENDLDRTKDYIVWGVLWATLLGVLYLLMTIWG